MKIVYECDTYSEVLRNPNNNSENWTHFEAVQFLSQQFVHLFVNHCTNLEMTSCALKCMSVAHEEVSYAVID